MSNLKQYFPANRLSEALSRARPISVEQCLKQADENLRQIADACADHVDRTLELLEATLRDWPETRDVGYLDTLYKFSLRLIGSATTAGLPDLDRAAASLCQVLEGLAVSQVWDRVPIDIHLGAFRLLRHPSRLSGGASELLAGLDKIRARYVAT